MTRKYTAGDRPEFHRKLRQTIAKHDIGVAEISPEAVIICSRAEDFDPESNVLWEHEANKSAVRPDVHCTMCKSVVALSNHAYAKYTELDKKPRVCCGQCLASGALK